MRRTLAAGGACVLVVTVGIVLLRAGDDSAPTRTKQESPAVVSDGAPESTQLVPSAEAAAVAAVGLTGEVVTAGFISRRELIESFTTPSFGPQLADITSQQVTEMQLAQTEAGVDDPAMQVIEFPLNAHTVSQDATTATVEVWSVLVVAAPSEPVGRQAWRTVTVAMRLIDGRWLVDGWESIEGPTPAPLPEGRVATGREIADRMDWPELTAEVE